MPIFRRRNAAPCPTGYVRRADAIKEFIRSTHKPFLRQQNDDIRRSGQNVQVRLVRAYEAVTGVPYELLEWQELGDCVGQHFTLGVDALCAVEVTAGQREEWRGRFSTEVTYALSRVEVGGGRIRGDDGSTGAWAAQALLQYGSLLRGRYGDYDLTKYRPDLAKRWGDMGCPDELEREAREHPIKAAPLVESAAEAADSIANGYPVPICSNQGFTNKTDKDGFLTPRGKWYHCMLAWGVDTKSERKGFELAQKWPLSWVSGPKHKLGTAACGFWVDYEVVDRMLRQGDSYALADFVGFPRRKLDYVLM